MVVLFTTLRGNFFTTCGFFPEDSTSGWASISHEKGNERLSVNEVNSCLERTPSSGGMIERVSWGDKRQVSFLLCVRWSLDSSEWDQEVKDAERRKKTKNRRTRRTCILFSIPWDLSKKRWDSSSITIMTNLCLHLMKSWSELESWWEHLLFCVPVSWWKDHLFLPWRYKGLFPFSWIT